MWNSFQGALEKRVRENGRKKPQADKYIIFKAAKKVLMDLFGSSGRDNIEIILETEHKIKLKSQKSIWRSELTLKKNLIRRQINREIGVETVKEVVIFG